MSPVSIFLREALRQDGIEVGDAKPADGEGWQFLVNGQHAVRLIELPRERRICLFWSSGEAPDPAHGGAAPWVQHQRSDAQGAVWTQASHPGSGARIMASSVCAHATDMVSFRDWFGNFLDWVSDSAD